MCLHINVPKIVAQFCLTIHSALGANCNNRRQRNPPHVKTRRRRKLCQMKKITSLKKPPKIKRRKNGWCRSCIIVPRIVPAMVAPLCLLWCHRCLTSLCHPCDTLNRIGSDWRLERTGTQRTRATDMSRKSAPGRRRKRKSSCVRVSQIMPQRARKGWCDRLSQLVPDIVSVSHCDCLSKGHSFRSYSRQT